MILGILIVLIVVCLGFLAWLFCIAPASPRGDFAEMKKYDYAHRGLHEKDLSVPENSMAGFKAAVDAAKDAGIAISGSISMPFGSPWEKEIPLSDVKSITQAYIDTGITEISLSDTAGVAYPSQVYNYCVEMAKEFPQVTWWMHFHNTRGLAIANIVAAMEAGFTRFDSSFAGAGGCPFVPGAAGNVSTEDVVHMMDQMGIKTGIDLDKMIAIGKRVGEILNHDSSSYILKAGPASALIRELPTGQAKANNAK